jgi:hypothetical protein
VAPSAQGSCVAASHNPHRWVLLVLWEQLADWLSCVHAELSDGPGSRLEQGSTVEESGSIGIRPHVSWPRTKIIDQPQRAVAMSRLLTSSEETVD